MRYAGITLIFIGAALAVFGLFIGVEVAFGNRVMHLPTGISGSALLICGVLLFGFSQIYVVVLSIHEARISQAFELNPKWKALLEYDGEVHQAAMKIRARGLSFEREMAGAYLALDNKSYLPLISERLEGGLKFEVQHPAG